MFAMSGVMLNRRPMPSFTGQTERLVNSVVAQPNVSSLPIPDEKEE